MLITARRTGPLPRRRVHITGIGQLVTCTGPDRGPLRDFAALGSVDNAELVVCHGLEGGWQVQWLGQSGDAKRPSADTTVDLGGRVLLPGLVDCHTHLVFAGDRAHEFAQRLSGVSYQELAAKGGGILHTVAATRAASLPELVQSAATRLDELVAQGVRMVEIKTGYGLSLASERKILAVIAALQLHYAHQLHIVATAMPAHAVAPEFKSDPDGYVQLVCEQILPALAAEQTATFVDIFLEKGYFDVAQADRIWQVAKRLGLGLKAHVDEFAEIGGLQWAVSQGATSVEHLLQTTPQGIAVLAKSETVAVGLPLTSVFLREPTAPLRALVDAHALVAVATDCNPGSAMTTNLTLAIQMAVLLTKLTPAEAVRAVTRSAAQALGCPSGYRGRVAVGEPFLPTVLDLPRIDQLFYQLGRPACGYQGLLEAGVG